MLKPLARIPIEQRGIRNATPNSTPISCFCCRDSALVIPWVAQRYAIADYSLSDLPILCQRISCNARSVWIDTPDSSAQRRVDRYNFEQLDNRLKPDDCEEIHRAERARIQSLEDEEEELRMPDLSGIGRSMPRQERYLGEAETAEARRAALSQQPPEDFEEWQ